MHKFNIHHEENAEMKFSITESAYDLPTLIPY